MASRGRLISTFGEAYLLPASGPDPLVICGRRLLWTSGKPSHTLPVPGTSYLKKSRTPTAPWQSAQAYQAETSLPEATCQVCTGTTTAFEEHLCQYYAFIYSTYITRR